METPEISESAKAAAEEISRLRWELQRQVFQNSALEHQLQGREEQLAQILNSTTWRATGPLRRFLTLIKGSRKFGIQRSMLHQRWSLYDKWIQQFEAITPELR